MATTPITPPGGGAVVPVTGPGRSYVASGPCSGTAFVHRQSFFASYQFVTYPSLDSTWLPTQGSPVSGVLLHMNPSYQDTLEQFSTSSTVSGCANAANARQEHIIDFSGNAAAGMGTEGIITTSATGFTRRWQQVGDVVQNESYSHPKVFLELDSVMWNLAQSNDTAATEVVRQVIRFAATGGLPYVDGNRVTPPMSKFDLNLVYI